MYGENDAMDVRTDQGVGPDASSSRSRVDTYRCRV